MRATFAARMIQVAAGIWLAGMLFVSQIGPAHAEKATQLEARVSLSTQTMQVLVDGRPTFAWKVSTARKGYVTPTGSWRPTRLEAMWHSRQYDNAPMPHAVFFSGGYAVHATDAVKRLGRPASHGCVRLHPDNAADFFQLVATFGSANTRITIVE